MRVSAIAVAAAVAAGCAQDGNMNTLGERYVRLVPAMGRHDQQRVRFIDQYRSYVINYNLGKDLVAAHVEAAGGTADNPAKRWNEFARLISSPRLPSGLTARLR